MLPRTPRARAGGGHVQVADGIHRLTQGVCNFYLIEEGGRLVLVDAGAPADWNLLVRTLPTLGRALDDLEAVLITHAHSDHTGFAERARTTAHAPVWIHQADAAVAKGATPARNDGKALDLPGRPRAVHAPGHTPGSAALLLEGRRVLLTGDTLVTRNPLTGRLGPQIMPSGLNQDTPLALRSLDALDGIPADVLLPGHGDPFTEGATEAVRQARAAGP